MKKAVYIEIEENIAIIKFNRPERYNAVNQDVIDCLNDLKVMIISSWLFHNTNVN